MIDPGPPQLSDIAAVDFFERRVPSARLIASVELPLISGRLRKAKHRVKGRTCRAQKKCVPEQAFNSAHRLDLQANLKPQDDIKNLPHSHSCRGPMKSVPPCG